MAASTEDARLTRLSEICLALPEAVRALRGDHADFRVRQKVFAYFLNNHHGDGIVSVCVKSALGEGVDRAARLPERYYLPAYIGARGWFGLRLDRGAIDWRSDQHHRTQLLPRRAQDAGARGGGAPGIRQHLKRLTCRHRTRRRSAPGDPHW
jgi:hypothetical protein